MAKNISLLGASYPAVPAVTLPITGGGTAKFIDEDDVITYRTGTTPPASSLGEDGDIYLQVIN